MAAPPHQICPLCGLDDEIETVHTPDGWVMSCDDRSHPPFEWRPTEPTSVHGTYRTGVGVELGVYDDLLECVEGGLAEYGVIEYRYSQRFPATYRVIIERYGHRALAPSKYTASSFLGGALGQLWREEEVNGIWGTATGYWKYNGEVGVYASAGTSEDSEILSWEDFATNSLGVDPLSWPPLEYTP